MWKIPFRNLSEDTLSLAAVRREGFWKGCTTSSQMRVYKVPWAEATFIDARIYTRIAIGRANDTW